jgi:V8-like Glu-specific endopeptidase
MPVRSPSMDPDKLKAWLERLRTRDPKLHAELSKRLMDRYKPTIMAKGALERAPLDFAVTLETIVREGRPALLINQGRISRDDSVVEASAKAIVNRLMQAAKVLEAVIPLVGRIDVENYPGAATYLGTGWLIAPDIVVTNRHVAELIGRWDGGSYRFRAGRFGDPISVSVDYRHELGSAETDIADVERIIWIESDPTKADIAFLKVKRRSDGARQDHIELAESDPVPGRDVAVVGYPARAPADIIPDQDWMNRIYGSVFDIKRIAPGLIDNPDRNWTTHDCTTLGGNSGSVVLDMKTGRAVALHFAGLYMVENYAVPASVVRQYLKDEPWTGATAGKKEAGAVASSAGPPAAPPPARAAFGLPQPVQATDSGAMSITVPLTITISLGAPSSAALKP